MQVFVEVAGGMRRHIYQVILLLTALNIAFESLNHLSRNGLKPFFPILRPFAELQTTLPDVEVLYLKRP